MNDFGKYIIKRIRLGNVTQVTSNNPWLQNQTFTETFTYDASDQLTSATESQNQSYQLAVTYGNWGKINSYSLTQTDLQSNTSQSEAQAYSYPVSGSLGDCQTLFAPEQRTITDANNNLATETLAFGINGSLRKREVQAQASYTEYYLFNSAANLKAYSNNGLDFAYYGYNAANTRSYKLSMLNQNQWVNGQPEPIHLQLQSAMFYPNAYLNFNQNGEYTKHYYNGAERVCSRLGEHPVSISTNTNDLLGFRIMQADQQARADLLELVEAGDVPIETPSVDVTVLQPTGTASDIFYYHMNHLGSTAFVTDQNQNVTQGFLYAPFGEITTEYAPSWQNGTLPKYSFNAKELDEETGMYYYEARYYKPPVFTSRDPMFEKYFWMTPYAYCANNPVKYVDPSGEHIEVTENEDGTYTVSGGELNRDRNIYVMKDGKRTGQVIGQTLTKYSFFGDNDEVVTGAVINLNDNSGQEFLDDFMTNTPDLNTYIFDEKNGGRKNGYYDFKRRGESENKQKATDVQYYSRGMSIVIDGKKRIASARDIGNYAAGYIAGKNGISWLLARIAFDIYQGGKEPNVTKSAEILGHSAGIYQYYLNHPIPWK